MKCKYKKFLKAAYINYEEDYCGYGSGTFTKPTVTTPIIVITGTTATIACAISGATIYYTLDGSTPTSNSTEYTGTITLTQSCTIKAIAVKPGMSDSGVASESYVHYLTQWKIVGNSEMHGVGNLTSWKVSGNSVVDNNTILSCGDLGQDGKYHVKISNGVDVFDIALTEPLRKVNDVADTIEFPSNTEGKALVTRPFASENMGSFTWRASQIGTTGYYRMLSSNLASTIKTVSASSVANALTPIYTTITANLIYNRNKGIAVLSNGNIVLYDDDYNQSDSASAFKTAMQGVELIYELVTPTTELIDVSPFPVSSTDTYTSVNVIPFSAFEHTENKEIWSCGEYNPLDGKYHILVQPQGGSIADIALIEPLRKVNDVTDTIEFPSDTEGKALVTRPLKSVLIGDCSISRITTNTSNTYRWKIVADAKASSRNILSAKFAYTSRTYFCEEGVGIDSSGGVIIFDSDYSSNAATFKSAYADVELIYELATLTTELVDAPQIEEADSYSCVISQGGKAVEWSSFTPNPS